MSATNRGSERKAFDAYSTPPWCVERLLEAVDLPMGDWLEPCAGNGAIIKTADRWYATHRRGHGPNWTAVEIQRECQPALRKLTVQTFIHDFLTWKPTEERFDVVLTNPPYGLAQPIIEKCLTISSCVVMLLRLNFLSSEERAEFMRAHTPSVLVLPNRPDFTGGGGDSIEYAWYVWDGRFTPQVFILDSTPQEIRKPNGRRSHKETTDEGVHRSQV